MIYKKLLFILLVNILVSQSVYSEVVVEGNVSTSSTSKQAVLQAKELCKNIGYDFKSEKFNDCVLKVTTTNPRTVNKTKTKIQDQEYTFTNTPGQNKNKNSVQVKKYEAERIAKEKRKAVADLIFCSTRNGTWGYISNRINCPFSDNEVTYEKFVLNILTNNQAMQPLDLLNMIYSEFKLKNLDFSLVNDIIKKNKTLRKYRKHTRTYKTQIVKVEPTVKTKKKVKVAKVEEPKQEEFKPKKTNQDNEAPIITIAEAITVNDSSYEIEGRVSDSSKNIFVQVDGRTIPVKKGKFKIKRFSPIDEQIEIIATDQWGNRSSPKMVSIIIDKKNTIVADTFENLDPSKIRSKSNKNRVALIIGIEKYDQTPDATFANLDAQYFYEYARKGFGISKFNIKLLVDEDANLIQSLGTLSKWLPGKIKDGKTELIIFFAGHGLASNDGRELYLLPQDSDPDLLTRTALSRTELFKAIISLNPKSVTMFLDTCYSGVSRDEKTLLASARPIRIVAKESNDTPDNFTIFSASQLDQISSGLKEAKHGIFSYYLMKGLEGNADSNRDRKITNGEMLSYLQSNVSQQASSLGRNQNPSLAGNEDNILLRY